MPRPWNRASECSAHPWMILQTPKSSRNSFASSTTESILSLWKAQALCSASHGGRRKKEFMHHSCTPDQVRFAGWDLHEPGSVLHVKRENRTFPPVHVKEEGLLGRRELDARDASRCPLSWPEVHTIADDSEERLARKHRAAARHCLGAVHHRDRWRIAAPQARVVHTTHLLIVASCSGAGAWYRQVGQTRGGVVTRTGAVAESGEDASAWRTMEERSTRSSVASQGASIRLAHFILTVTPTSELPWMLTSLSFDGDFFFRFDHFFPRKK